MCWPQNLVVCFLDHMIGSRVAIVFPARRQDCDCHIHSLGNGEAPFLALFFCHSRICQESLFGIVFRWCKLDAKGILKSGTHDFIKRDAKNGRGVPATTSSPFVATRQICAGAYVSKHRKHLISLFQFSSFTYGSSISAPGNAK